MTKKTMFGISLLFLFAFTFGFAFALAGSAHADSCCPYETCWTTGETTWGHMDKGECVFNGLSGCDVAVECGDPNW